MRTAGHLQVGALFVGDDDVDRVGRRINVQRGFKHWILGGIVEERDRARHVGHVDRLEERQHARSEEHTSELQSLMRISYAVFCLKKKKQTPINYEIKSALHNTHK